MAENLRLLTKTQRKVSNLAETFLCAEANKTLSARIQDTKLQKETKEILLTCRKFSVKCNFMRLKKSSQKNFLLIFL